MKIAVLADIHGNLEALTAVTADLQQQGADRIICLGDSIGYGPDPEEVVCHLRRLHAASVLGNHEFALMDERARRWLNFQAAENNIATEKLLSAKSKEYCCTLPTSLTVADGHFVHAYPPDSVFRYLNRQSDGKIADLFAAATSRLFFVGHTHRLVLVSGQKRMISRRSLGQELVTLAADQKYIVNCGSVGQPRGDDHRAQYLLWDAAAGQLAVRYVAYDRYATMQKIKERGFPEVYAMRLV